MPELQSMGIVASAGTGKTYQLAQRFLALLALDPGAGRVPFGAESLVALTFTRKAAREFAGRILDTLAKAASSEAEAQRLGQRLVSVWNGAVTDPVFGELPALVGGGYPGALPTRADFERMLGEVADRLDQLQLSTLDAFFTRVARGFALELGMAGFELLDDAGRSRAQAEVLGGLFARGAEAGSREQWAHSLQRAHHGREVTRWGHTVKELLRSYEDAWLTWPDPAIWGGLMPRPGLLTESEFAQRAARVRELVNTGNGLTGNLTDHQEKQGLDSLGKLLEWMERGAVDSPPDTKAAQLCLGNVAGLLTGDWEYPSGKKSARLDPLLAQDLGELIQHTAAVRLNQVLERSRGLGETLDHYDAAYAARVRRRGELGFGELSALLAGSGVLRGAGAVDPEMRFDLEARLDAKIEHWFLDEFQDTSRTQWRVLQRWLDEVIQDAGGDRSLFVVGDPKQAIYGWRGGDAELFGELWELPGWDSRLQRWGMSRSFRCTQPVLEMVNAVCRPEVLTLLDGVRPELVERWEFEPHESGAAYGASHPQAGQPLAGYAAVWELPRKPTGRGAAATDDEAEGTEEPENEGTGSSGEQAATINPQDPRWQTTARIIVEAGVLERGLSVAVLVRKKQTARDAGESLRRLFLERGLRLPVEIEGTSELVSSSALGLALADAFLWLDQPGDRLAAAHLAHGILGAGLAGLGGTPEARWRKLWELWSRGGPSAVIQALTADLDEAQLGAFQLAKRADWTERAQEWMQAGGGSLADWRRVLAHAGQVEQARRGSVAVLTVHKAKGLEWDLVIYAEPGNGRGKWCDTTKRKLLAGQDENGQPFVVSQPPDWLVEQDARLQQAHQLWEDRQAYEGLCLGYVAMTRARHALHVVMEPLSGSFRTPQRRGDHWIRAGLGCLEIDGSGPADGQLLWETGDRAWFETLPQIAENQQVASARPVLGAVRPRLRRRLPSASAASGAGFPRPMTLGEGTRYGALLHAAAARLPLQPGAFAGLPWELDEELGDPLEAEVRATLARAWQDPDLAWAWGKVGGGAELWTERGFEIVLTNPGRSDPGAVDSREWVSGVFDRVLLRRDASGLVTAARLIEIKTDAAASLAEVEQRHAGQLGLYRRVLARLVNLDEANIEARILWLPRAAGQPGQAVATPLATGPAA